jgi:autotransporter passenger strand-loop-strand repeat protein
MSGTTSTISNGQTSTGLTVSAGETLTVNSGGTANATTVQSGGVLVVSGIDSGAIVLAGGSETVSSGGSAGGDQISGTLVVGVSGGKNATNGTANNETVFNGGVLDLFAGSTSGATIGSGGTLVINGGNTATNTVLSGGGTVELQTSGATVAGTLTFEGGGNTLLLDKVLSSGATAGVKIMSFSSTDKIVVSGATAVAVSSSGGEAIATVTSGGVTDALTFSGSQFNSNTLSWVASSGVEVLEFTSATASGTTTSTVTSVTTSTASVFTETAGNTLLVLSGGSVSAPIIDSGAFLVISGGADTAAVISSGGTETVSVGSATGDQISGAATVDSGATVTSETIENGGLLTVNSGGIDSSTTISAGGNETVFGSASGDQIFGTQLVSAATAVVTNETVFNGGNLNLFLKGGIATGTIVSTGGFLNVNGAAFASNTVLSSGGTLELQSPKAEVTGTLTFAGGGNTLEFTAATDAGMGDLALMSGFTSTDKIALTSSAFVGSDLTLSPVSMNSSGNTVVDILSAGSVVETFTFAGALSGGVTLVSDGNGGEDVTLIQPTSVTTSTASGTFTETSGHTLLVLSGGSVSAPIIDSGAFLTVSGGVDTSATILSGGTETVSTGAATGDQIFGSALIDGGTVSSETVLSGGVLTISGAASVSNTVLSSGGVVDLASPTAALTGSLTFSSGGNTLEASAIATSGNGDEAVISGFSTTDKIDVTAIGAAGATLNVVTSGSNNVATITSGSNSESFIFAGTSTYTNFTLQLESDGSGGVDLVFNPNAVALTVSSGTTSTGLTVASGETLTVQFGGTVSATNVQSGGSLIVSGTDHAAIVSAGGAETVFGSATGDQIAGGVTVEGTATSETVQSNGALIVNGGVNSAATISSGGAETVTSSGSTRNDQIFGSETVSSGGTATSETVMNGGALVINGGVNSAATVSSGGAETVTNSGSTSADQIFGSVTVSSATVTSETVESGGLLTLNAGGVDVSTTILAGGTELVSAATGSATATGDQIFGTLLTSSGNSGIFTGETVFSGGVLNLLNSNDATNTLVLSGGTLNLSGHETATDTTLSGGALLDLQSPKATLSGTLMFAGGGNTLELTDTTDAGDGDLALMSGFSSTDKIDMTSAAFVGSSLTLSPVSVVSGNTVVDVLSAGSAVETFTFAGTSFGGSLTLVSDGNGGEDLEILPVSVTTPVTTSTASGAFTETATNTLLVLSGGSVSAATIDAGGFLTVSGGADFAATVLSGGLETVFTGSATGDQIFGSAIVDGGTVTNETVLSGGVLAISGTASVTNISLSGGGVVDLASPGAVLSGALTFAGGNNTLEASAIATSGNGDQAVISGFSSSDKIDVTGISPTGASLSFATNGNGNEVVTVNGTSSSESFIFSNPAAYNSGTLSLIKDGNGGVDLILDTTPVVTFTSIGGTTNKATQIVNGTVNTTADPEAIGSIVSVLEGNTVVGTAKVGANGFWSANVTFLNDNGTNVLTASDIDAAGNKGVTSQPLTFNVNTTAAAFTPGNLVISISGDGDGSGVFGDNQASPITLEQITTTGSIVSQLVLPQTTTVVNGVTENAISGEFGSSSEGILQLSADGHSLVIAGYGINANMFNEGGAAVFGNAALAQTTSVPGGQFTPVSRVIADINADGVVDTSTALFNVFDTNNPRSVATVNGSSFFISGQGVKGDTTQGVFLAQDGASSATSIDDATDTRTAEIVNGQLFVSVNTTQGPSSGTTGILNFGSSLPTGTTTPTFLQGLTNSVTLTSASANNVNGADIGTSVNLSPESFFFANADTLYVADGGDPKEGGLGDGGLQKWVFNGSEWTLQYTLSAGLNLIPNTDSTSNGDTGLIGLTGQVVGNNVELFATTEPLNDLGQTAVVSITDALNSTTGTGESFSTVLTASPGENIRGISFAPTPFTPTITGTKAGQTTTSEAPVTPFSGVTIGDGNANAVETLTITLTGGGTLSDGASFMGTSTLTNPSTGVYTLSGTALAVTTELDALSFKPAAGAPNTSSTTTFTLSDLSSADATPTVDSTTTVIDTDPAAVAPTITGTKAGQTTTSEAPVKPFSGVTIGDANSGAMDTLTITLAGGGTLSGAGLSGSNGTYTLSGTALAITTELDALSFTPVDGVPNTSVTTTFTLSDKSNAFATATVNNTTTVIDSDPAVAPTITGTKAGQTTTSEAPVKPFSGVTIGDANSGATDTLTITLAGGGTLSGTGLTGSNGTYTLSGTALAVTTELDALSFTPVDGVPNTSVTTTFTLSDKSNAFATATVNNTTTVIDSDPAAPPQTVTEPNSGGTVTLGNGNDTVTLDGIADSVTAGNGNDTVKGGQGFTNVTLGNGADTVTLSGFGNNITAGSGNDVVNGGSGDANVKLGGGNDAVTLSTVDNSVTAGNGNDTVSGGLGLGTIVLGNGADNVTAGGSFSTITVGNGNDTVTALAGLNTIVAGSGTDTIILGGIDNTLTLNGSTATVTGGQGFDDIKVNGGTDKLTLRGDFEQVTLAGTTTASITDLGQMLRLNVASNTQTDTISGFGTSDVFGVVDLKNGVGGFNSVAAIVDALHSDGHGGTVLSLGNNGSIDFVGTAPNQIHASNFAIG